MIFSLLISLCVCALITASSSDLDYTTYGKDYSCYHKVAWNENKDDHYAEYFDSYTGILTSKFVEPTSSGSSTGNTVKHFKVAGGTNEEDIWTRMLRSSSYFTSFFSREPTTLSFTSKKNVKQPLRGMVAPSALPPPPSGGGPPPPSMSGTPPPGGPPPPSMSGTPPPGTTPPPGGGGGLPPPSSGGGTGTSQTSAGYVTTGWKVLFTGIPLYDHNITASEITTLNSRPKKSTDFRSNSATTAQEGEYIRFGEDINYSKSSCSLGFWPPGPECPSNYTGTGMYDLEPAPEVNVGGCYTSNTVGFFVSGVGAWSWTDTKTYNDENVWHNLAMEFEEYDMDICGGHAASGVYHHHSYSPCLATLLKDTGDGHSPIYGFANDAYPIYGPYQAANTLAVSCWKARDYASTSATGCSNGDRSCILVDMFNYTLGTVTASKAGPSITSTVSTQSGNTINAASGIYIEDFYFDADCAAQGGEYLNSFNGHDHDNIGFHYHVTVDSNKRPTFPFIVGPKYYGCVRDGACSTTMFSLGPPSSSSATSTCGTSAAVPLASQQCKTYIFQSNVSLPVDTSTTSTSSSSSSSDKPVLSTTIIGIIAGVGGLVAVLLSVSSIWYYCGSSSTSTVGNGKLNYDGVDLATAASGQQQPYRGVEMTSSAVAVPHSSGGRF